MKKQTTLAFDYLGISSASICLIHCLVFPFLSFIPIALSHNHYIDLFFASLGIIPVVKILKTNAKLHIKILLSVSMLLIVGSLLGVLFLHHHSILLYFGGIGMILGHILNFKSHKHIK